MNSIAQGLKKGETLPLLPAAKGADGRSARDARNRRPAPVVHADGRAAIDAVSVPVRPELHAQEADAHVHRARGEHSQLPPDLHGRPQASRRARSDLVRPFDRLVRQSDTLVIDSVGFNDKFWFDRQGTPHTEQLHTIERWTRVNMGTLTNEVTIDDPGAFSRPFTVTFNARLQAPGDEIMEYICQENNQYGVAGGHQNPFAQ